MARKTLSVSREAYDALAQVKSRRESFTDVILRLTAIGKKGSLLEYVKSLEPDEKLAEALERILEKRAKLRLARAVSLRRQPYSKHHQEETQGLSAKTHQIEEKIVDLVAILYARFSVNKALLFGSTARGSRLQESDIDLIVVSKGFEDLSMPERQGAVQKE